MATNRKNLKERTFICSATDMSAEDLFEEKQEDEFAKATQFASKYFKVFESCYNKSSNKTHMREDVYSNIGGVRTKRNSMYENFFHEWCEQNGYDYVSPDEVLHEEGYEAYKDMEHYITMKIHEFKSNWG